MLTLPYTKICGWTSQKQPRLLPAQKQANGAPKTSPGFHEVFFVLLCSVPDNVALF